MICAATRRRLRDWQSRARRPRKGGQAEPPLRGSLVSVELDTLAGAVAPVDQEREQLRAGRAGDAPEKRKARALHDVGREETDEARALALRREDEPEERALDSGRERGARGRLGE